MIAYLIKSGLCLVILLGIYLLFLEREKMHHFNRFFLLFAVIVGLSVPQINLNFNSNTSVAGIELENVERVVQLPAKTINELSTSSTELITETISSRSKNKVGISDKEISAKETKVIDNSRAIEEQTISGNDNSFNLSDAILLLYLIIAFSLILRLIYGLYGFRAKKRSAAIINYGSAHLALVSAKIVPHTFLNTIYVNKTQFESGELSKEILDHELTHARQKHSLDVLVIELLRIVFWFNPIFYFYKRAIQINHEFLADDSVITKTQDSASYQKLLLDSIFPTYQTNLASTFNYSLTKKRFKMMVKESSIMSLATRKIILLPVILSVVLIFCTETTTPDDVLYPSVKLSYGAEEINGYMHTVAKKRDGELFTGTQIMRFKKDDRLFGHTNYKNGIAESATRFDSTGARIDHINYTTVEGDFRLKDRTIIVDDKEVLIEEWIYPHETEDGIGSHKQWHKNGVLKSEATFRKGFQYFGLVTVYDENGKIIKQARYEDGKEVEVLAKTSDATNQIPASSNRTNIKNESPYLNEYSARLSKYENVLKGHIAGNKTARDVLYERVRVIYFHERLTPNEQLAYGVPNLDPSIMDKITLNEQETKYHAMLSDYLELRGTYSERPDDKNDVLYKEFSELKKIYDDLNFYSRIFIVDNLPPGSDKYFMDIEQDKGIINEFERLRSASFSELPDTLTIHYVNELGNVVTKRNSELTSPEIDYLKNNAKKSNVTQVYPLPVERKPTDDEIKKWQDDYYYQTWYDGEVVENKKLLEMDMDEIHHFRIHKIRWNGNRRVPYDYQVLIYSYNAFNEMVEKYRPNKSMMALHDAILID
ncbi:MAG: M56 family metallopeptidase [Balneola sp.]